MQRELMKKMILMMMKKIKSIVKKEKKIHNFQNHTDEIYNNNSLLQLIYTIYIHNL